LLRSFFTGKTTLIGILLLQVVLPLSVTGYFMEGDFITLLFYLLALNLMLRRRDVYLPLLVGVATLNREQIIFVLVFYVIYLISQGRVFRKRSMLIVAASIAAFLLGFFAVRCHFGFPTTQYTIASAIAHNTNPHRLLRSIAPLWVAEVAGFAILSALAFQASNMFFKLAFLSLGLYSLLFFISGNLWELAKFLPAFLIMIPMSLQILTGEFVDERMTA